MLAKAISVHESLKEKKYLQITETIFVIRKLQLFNKLKHNTLRKSYFFIIISEKESIDLFKNLCHGLNDTMNKKFTEVKNFSKKQVFKFRIRFKS
jgi:hypothetical protein